MPAEDSDRERRRRRHSRDPESDRERRRDDSYRRRRGHRATDSQGDLLPRGGGGDRSSRDYGSSNATPRSRRESRATSSSRQQLSTGSLAQSNTVNAKKGFAQQEYDADYLEEVRAKEKRMEKERRREERETRRAERAERHADREERRRMSEMEASGAEMTDRERRREEERERRREEKRQARRAEKAQEKERLKQEQLALAQEQADAEARERQRHAEREKQRQLRREQEAERQRRRDLQRRYDDEDSYASSPAPSPQKSKWRGGAAYDAVRNEDSPRAKYFEKAYSPKKKSRVISGPYLEDQQDEVYEYRRDKLEGSSQASDYTSTTIWKKKRNKRICETCPSKIRSVADTTQAFMWVFW